MYTYRESRHSLRAQQNQTEKTASYLELPMIFTRANDKCHFLNTGDQVEFAISVMDYLKIPSEIDTK